MGASCSPTDMRSANARREGGACHNILGYETTCQAANAPHAREEIETTRQAVRGVVIIATVEL
jgi:hypothetical protein